LFLMRIFRFSSSGLGNGMSAVSCTNAMKKTSTTFTSRYNLVLVSDRDFAHYVRYLLCIFTLRFELPAYTVFTIVKSLFTDHMVDECKVTKM